MINDILNFVYTFSYLEFLDIWHVKYFKALAMIEKGMFFFF